MEEYKLSAKEIKQQRDEIIRGAKSHIASILVALKRYKKGSSVERDYALEHVESLRKYYLEKL